MDRPIFVTGVHAYTAAVKQVPFVEEFNTLCKEGPVLGKNFCSKGSGSGNLLSVCTWPKSGINVISSVNAWLIPYFTSIPPFICVVVFGIAGSGAIVVQVSRHIR